MKDLVIFGNIYLKKRGMRVTAHIESRLEDIASTVIMPGDPLRAKMIAEKYLEDARLVNSIRGMLAYTGKYLGKEVTVFASGMGIPSIGIYAYELFHFYHVERIIRVGSCGAGDSSVQVGDVVLASSATSASNFAKLFAGDEERFYPASAQLNEKISMVAKEKGQELKVGDIITSDVFDVYVDHDSFMKNFERKTYLATEMEAFALFFLAKHLGKEAACLLTVVDSKYQPDVVISPEDRQNSLNAMIELALLTSVK